MYSSPPIYTPPPTYSPSSPPLNPNAAPYGASSDRNSTGATYDGTSGRNATAAKYDATSRRNSSAAPYASSPLKSAHSTSPLNPAALPYPASSVCSSLTPPPSEPWIPAAGEEISMDTTLFTDTPFSEDPFFSTVWRPLASDFLGASTLKIRSARDGNDDYDPLSDYLGGSLWSTEC